MPSPLINATVQACILNATSNLIAQLLTAYKLHASFTFTHHSQFSSNSLADSIHNRLATCLRIRALQRSQLSSKLPMVPLPRSLSPLSSIHPTQLTSPLPRQS